MVQPLVQYRVEVSGAGTVWTLDPANGQLVRVTNVSSSSPTVSVIPTVSEGDSINFSVAPDSETL